MAHPKAMRRDFAALEARRLQGARLLRPASRPNQRIPTGTVKSSVRGLSASGCSAGGTGSPCSTHDSKILRASPCAISVASTTDRPSATRPGTSGLVATNAPSSTGSMCSRMATSATMPQFYTIGVAIGGAILQFRLAEESEAGHVSAADRITVSPNAQAVLPLAAPLHIDSPNQRAERAFP